MIEDENFSITITYRAEDIECRAMNIILPFGKDIGLEESIKILKRMKRDNHLARCENDSYEDLPCALIDAYIQEDDTDDEAIQKEKEENAIWTDRYNKKRKTE